MFRSYDHLQVEIYLLELTLLATDPLFLEYLLTSWIIIVISLIDSWLLIDMNKKLLSIKRLHFINYQCGFDMLMGRLNLFLACQ
jgi:hypothetical protein